MRNTKLTAQWFMHSAYCDGLTEDLPVVGSVLPPSEGSLIRLSSGASC